MKFERSKIRYEIKVIGIDRKRPSRLYSYGSYEKCRKSIIKLYKQKREAKLYLIIDDDYEKRIGEVWREENKWNWYIEEFDDELFKSIEADELYYSR